MSSESLVPVGVVFTGYTIFGLRSAVDHIFCLGKGKTQLKRERKKFSLLNHILLTNYVEACKYHYTTARVLRALYWFYLVVIVGLVLLSTMKSPIGESLFSILLQFKVYCLDASWMLVTLLMTKHHPNGGVTWRWDKNN